MSEHLLTLYEFLTQLTGGARHLPSILRDSLEAICWGGLLLISGLKYKSTPDSHHRLLRIGFACCFVGALLTTSVIVMGHFKVLPRELMHMFFPPVGHGLADFGDLLIAGGYIRFLTKKNKEVILFLKGALGSVALVYISTTIWWALLVSDQPKAIWSETWCDWAFRINACVWMAVAIFFVRRYSVNQVWGWVCAALALFFLDDFLKIVDMSYGNIYKPRINPVRSLAHLLAILMLGYIFIREQAAEIKASFDSLEDIVADRTKKLERTTLELKESLEQQIRFTADASHELRTPLTMIMNEIQWALSQRKWPEVYQESLETAQFAARHMKGLLERLTDLAKMDRSGNRESFCEGDLSALVEQSTSVIRLLAERKNITVHFENADEPILITGDFDQLRQILINLGSNAVQYCPPDSSVWISLQKNKKEVIIKVRDNGPGIAAVDLPHVFERFYRSDKARTEIEEGSGLGLAICEEIARAHDGSLTVDSAEGEGATFILTLPLRV